MVAPLGCEFVSFCLGGVCKAGWGGVGYAGRAIAGGPRARMERGPSWTGWVVGVGTRWSGQASGMRTMLGESPGSVE